jgi:hypothetical protein
MGDGSSLRPVTVKRAVAIGLLLLIVGLLLGLTASAVTSFPTGAATELQSFLLSSSGGTIRTKELARASRPWALEHELGLVTAGDSHFFETDLRYGPTSGLVTGVPTSEIRSGSGGQGAPLPYPPREVWCVLVEGPAGRQVLVLARHHREPYQTDWIIHQQPSAPSPTDWTGILQLLGCRQLLADSR